MANHKILVVDDEPDILRVVKDVLESEHYTVKSAKNASEAFRRIKEFTPDLVVLDLKLPGTDGLEICRTLKADDNYKLLPILILSTKSEESDKIVGLEIGADDYVTKPFSSGELLARVKAILRRRNLSDDERAVSMSSGDLVLDMGEHVVKIKGKKIDLTPKEFDLLYILMKKKGKAMNRRFLIESVWGYEYFGTTRTVDVHIKGLREKLGSHGSKIVTVEGMGYKFQD
ncbi:MAG: response regulator [Elusimicrobia bacterium]|nr:response regulator [Elusimicrobiota bacterium]MBD3412144.1 response regulator [Elusimicrobiota bacterium]